MRLHFAAIPVLGGGEAEETLNQFLASHRVLSIDRHLIADGARSVWAVCVTYLDASVSPAADVARRGRVDYREVLSAEEFAVFAKLRALRKQLAEMVRRRVVSVGDLARIDGVGPARIERYATAFLDLLRSLLPGAPPAPTEV